jgi:cytochrome c
MSFFMNKVFGAILGTVLFAFVVIEVSHMLYPNPREVPHGDHMAYAVPGMEDAHHGENGGEAPAEPDFATLLASADVAAGEAQFRACGSCHNDAPGAANKVGPNLWGIVGAPIGGNASFNYSGAMGSHGGTWTFDALNQFLESPSSYIAGTAMSYRGMRRAGDRANLIAYLNQQGDTPLALPEPTVVEEAAATVEEAVDHASDVADDMMDDAVDAADTAEAAVEEAAEDVMDHAGEGGE